MADEAAGARLGDREGRPAAAQRRADRRLHVRLSLREHDRAERLADALADLGQSRLGARRLVADEELDRDLREARPEADARLPGRTTRFTASSSADSLMPKVWKVSARATSVEPRSSRTQGATDRRTSASSRAVPRA
jgi:hypothetical protein